MAGTTITYVALAKELGLHMAGLTAQLDCLIKANATAGQPFRAALQRQRLSPDNLPAMGFFLKAADLGRDVLNPAVFAADQRKRLWPPG